MREIVVRDVHVLATECPGEPGGDRGPVVLLPGLGAPWYLRPLLLELERRGRAAVLLDLPGFGRSEQRSCPPTVEAMGERVARWCAGEPAPVVLFGHSTGAQAMLVAALALQRAGRPPAGLVLAGPTPAPGQRSIPRLLLRVPLALRRESPAELGVLGNYLRDQAGFWRLLRSAVRDRPELTAAALALPVIATAGRADSFAPPSWLATLAGPDGRVLVLPGSHNNPFTHPDAVADVIAAADHGGPRSHPTAQAVPPGAP